MLLERRECGGCGIRFTPDNELQERCGECAPVRRAPQDSFAVPDAKGERVEAEEYW